MTPAEIRAKAEELRALLEKATPGPWESHCGYLVRAIQGDEAVSIAEMRGPYRYRVGLVRGHYEQDANLALIVAAVNALPALLAEVETLTAARASARAEALREGWRKAMEKASGVAVNAAITGVIGETEGEASGRGKTALRLSHGFDYLATNQEPADE